MHASKPSVMKDDDVDTLDVQEISSVAQTEQPIIPTPSGCHSGRPTRSGHLVLECAE